MEKSNLTRKSVSLYGAWRDKYGVDSKGCSCGRGGLRNLIHRSSRSYAALGKGLQRSGGSG